MNAAEHNADRLRKGTDNVVALLRSTSPGISDEELYEVCMMSAGVFAANAFFPHAANLDTIKRAAQLLVVGVDIGNKQRTEAEMKSCKGAA